MVGIYGIYLREDDTCLYIGQSKNIEYRWNKHKWRLENSKHLKSFSNWFDEGCYSIEDLLFKVLILCEDKDHLKNELEVLFFNKENPLFYGKVPSRDESWTPSLMTREKISVTNKNKTLEKFKHLEGDIKDMCDNPEVSFKEISEKLSMNKGTLRWYLKHHGWVCAYNRSSIKVSDVENLLDLRSQGKSLREIGRILGVDHETVRRCLKRNNTH